MIVLGIVIAYCAIALTLFRFVTLPNGMRKLDDLTKNFHYEDIKQQWRDSYRGSYVSGALAVAMFWPITMPFLLIGGLIMSSYATRTPAEIQREQKEEIERLRKLAREFKLPLGDDSTT